MDKITVGIVNIIVGLLYIPMTINILYLIWMYGGEEAQRIIQRRAINARIEK